MSVMKNKDYDISGRVGRGAVIDKITYATGLLDVIDFLYFEMKQFLKDEERCFGIVKSYINSIDDAFGKIKADMREEDIPIYGKILYLYKPILRKEFDRLTSKTLSSADAVIVIIRKLLTIIEEVPDYEHKREVKTIHKIIDKLYDNIRNHAKKDSLYNLGNIIKTYMTEGKIGRYPHDIFHFKVEEKTKPALTGSPDRMVIGGGKEISL